MTIEILSQIMIGLFGVTAVFFSQQKEESKRKWACIFGLLSQPFWFYSMYVSDQWGVFLLSFVYTISWLIGFKNYWLRID